MLKHFIKITFRNILSNKLYAGINILGLILSLSSAFIILLFLTTELSYDNFNKNRKQIYRIIERSRDFGTYTPNTPFYGAEFFASQIPGIKNTCRIQNIFADVKKNNELVPERNFICADKISFRHQLIVFLNICKNILNPACIFNTRYLTGKKLCSIKWCIGSICTKVPASFDYSIDLFPVFMEIIVGKFCCQKKQYDKS